jgi:transcription initiation factor TFIIIB Brf1 subunit/transcription initiation factor TFIIB
MKNVENEKILVTSKMITVLKKTGYHQDPVITKRTKEIIERGIEGRVHYGFNTELYIKHCLYYALRTLGYPISVREMFKKKKTWTHNSKLMRRLAQVVKLLEYKKETFDMMRFAEKKLEGKDYLLEVKKMIPRIEKLRVGTEPLLILALSMLVVSRTTEYNITIKEIQEITKISRVWIYKKKDEIEKKTGIKIDG